MRGEKNMSVSFAGLDQMVVTFRGEDVTAGYPVRLTGDGTVAEAGTGESMVGVALNSREGYVGVLLRGYTELPFSGTQPDLGWTDLLANGSGGVRTGSGGDGSHPCLVVSVDADKKIVGLFL
jgi:hypothetical protein